MTATGRFDPDELAQLEEQRQFLRRSLTDLDRELASRTTAEAAKE